jgi:hypothetical protein
VTFDGCVPPEWWQEHYGDRGWRAICGTWGTPNPARNAAIADCRADWCVIVDGDNWLSAGYLAAISESIGGVDHRTGIVYADISYCDDSGRERKRRHMPEYGYRNLRERNVISTTSAWRLDMLRDVGGFQHTRCFDDWSVATLATARGWRAIHGSGVIPVREGHGHRVNSVRDGGGMDYQWLIRTYGIVTLLSGRLDALPAWLAWLQSARLPLRTGLYVLDSSGDATFRAAVLKGLDGIRARFAHIDYASTARPEALDVAEQWKRAAIVARLYQQILPRVTEDMTVTLEDDVVPPLDGLHTLVACVRPGERAGAIAGAYLSRHGNGRVVACRGADYTSGRMYRTGVQRRLAPMGCVGGGFTLFHGSALATALPTRFGYEDGTPTGWDTYLCRAMRADGWGIYLHGGVWCEHNYR